MARIARVRAPALQVKRAVKVFSETMHRERGQLGEKITRWLQSTPIAEIDDIVVRQSSDSEFHCLTVIYFYREP